MRGSAVGCNGIVRSEKRRHRMNHAEFIEKHANCLIAMRNYFVQVEKTATMLAECTAEPLTFRERFGIMY
jgi:hypothetical protein